MLARTLESDRFYAMDRGYLKWELFNAIVAKGSSYACRARDNLKYECVEACELSPADQQAGVLKDEIIQLNSAEKTVKLDHRVRLVSIRCMPHTSRGRRSGRSTSSTAPSSDGVLRVLTNDCELPAELISQIYQHRWTVEIFFRMFKQLLGCRHLISSSPNGVEIQIYCAIIACMLIMIYTGHKPSKRTFEMICFYIQGWASLEELEKHIQKLQPK